jgi:hypothetical protein
MKIHLGELTFTEEVNQIREARRQAIRQRREALIRSEEEYRRIVQEEIGRFATEQEYQRILTRIRNSDPFNTNTSNTNTHNTNTNINHQPITITQKSVSNDVLNSVMKDDCAICMEKHTISESCETNCGHMFGSTCFSNWKKNVCPLCRASCTSITEFVEATTTTTDEASNEVSNEVN